MDYNVVFDQVIGKLYEEGCYCMFIDIECCKGVYFYVIWMWFDGLESQIIVWCGNDYLGMGQYLVVLVVMYEVLDVIGVGLGGMCNILGIMVYYKWLEGELVDLYGKEVVLVFFSVYIVNDVMFLMLCKLFFGLIIYFDMLNYVLMIEGIKCFDGVKCIFCYNDVVYLCELLQVDDFSVLKLIVFELIYLMDGDFGFIVVICDLVDEFNVLIYLDEVYVVGMYGLCGGGVVECDGLQDCIDIFNGMLGKVFGVFGGYIVVLVKMCDVIWFYVLGFIFIILLFFVVVVGVVVLIVFLKIVEGQLLCDQQQMNVCILKMCLCGLGMLIMDYGSYIVFVYVGYFVYCKVLLDMLLVDFGIYVQLINFLIVLCGMECLCFMLLFVYLFKEIDVLVKVMDVLWLMCKFNCLVNVV